ncbi:MAG: heavy metal-associated domain-containing protein, partial [Methylotenera sp.]
LYTLVFTLSLFSNTAFAAAQTLKVTVNGMVCAFCAQGIEKKVRALPQTHDVYVNLKQRIVAIELKTGQTISDDVLKDLIKDAGYDVTAIGTSDQPITQIKAEMESK